MTLSTQSVAGDLDISKLPGSDAALQSAVRKAALRFVPLLTIAYLFNYLDRTSLGFAALTMNKQLGLSASQFGLAAGIFFVGYSLFEIPSNLMLYRFGARRWLARIMISWGIVSTAMVFVVGPNSFYALRLLLGIAEAGFFPGVTFFLAAWFPVQFRTRMLAWFLIRNSFILAGRRPDLRRAAADGGDLGSGRMAMVVYRRQPAMHPVGAADAALARRSAGDRDLADP
jgi:MFS transporter, ACS family, tartrate transporter